MLGVGGAATLAGCAGDDNGNGDENGGTDLDGEIPDRADSYNVNTSASFTTLNPIYNTENNAGTAIGRALDQGYTFDADNEFFPLLYDMSTDQGEVWVFEVRENLEFSDPYGQVTAEDFVYYIQELHQSDWANTANGLGWQGVEVEQNGEFEFQAELENPQLLWPETFDPLLYPIPKDLIEPYVDEEDVDGLRENEELLELQFSGNLGPYVLDEWQRDAGTSYTRNDEYYLKDVEDGPELFSEAPYFDEASIDVVEEQSSRLGQLEAGEVDNAAIPPEQYQAYDNDPEVNVLQVPTPYNTIISVNQRDNGWETGPGNLFQIKEFRQAVACAVGKQELIDGVYRGLAQPHYTWQPRFSEFYPGDDDLPLFGMDDMYGSEVARDLAEDAFAESEYDYSFDGDDMITPDGDQVVLDIYHSQGQETSRLTAEFIRDELDENLGIEVDVEAIDGNRFNNEYWTADPEGGTDTVDGEEVEWSAPTETNPGPRSVTSEESWDMSLVFGLNTYPRNPLTNDAFFDGATGFYNPVGYYPEFDAAGLFDEAQDAQDEETLAEALEELFVNIAEEQPYITLLFSDDLEGYNPDLVGPIENFSNGWDFPGWHID